MAAPLFQILGSGMSNKMWDVLVEHSKTCALSGNVYVYYPDEPRNVGVVFNNIYALSGLIAGGQYHSIDSLSESQRVSYSKLVEIILSKSLLHDRLDRSHALVILMKIFESVLL